MPAHSGAGRRWRRFLRRNGVAIAVAVIVLLVLVVVGLMMYFLTSMEYRLR